MRTTMPTVSGVDYPAIGLAQCWNDLDAGVLWTETYCATAARRGAATRFAVDRLPNPAALRVTLDDNLFDDWSVTGANLIEMRTKVDAHRFRIVTGFTCTSRLVARGAASTVIGAAIVAAHRNDLHAADASLRTPCRTAIPAYRRRAITSISALEPAGV